MPDTPEPPGSYGWVAAAVTITLGAFGTLWAAVRKGRREDSTTALTHANRIIKGHERYAETLEQRVEEYQQMLARAETQNRELKSDLTAALIEAERLAKHNADLEDQLARRGD